MAKTPRRYKQCVKAINHLNDLVVMHTEADSFYQEQLMKLANSLEYMSIERKQHRALFLAKTRNTKMSFSTRLLIAIKFVLLGRRLEDLNENKKKIHTRDTQKSQRTSHKKTG